jgi:hypothetical protein
MTITDLHPTIREALALHESFRRLNFTPDEIYLRPRTDDAHVTVKRGALEFNAFAGKHDMTVPELIRKWAVSTEWWNSVATHKEQDEIFRGSKVYANSMDFVASVVAKGFSVRKWDA